METPLSQRLSKVQLIVLDLDGTTLNTLKQFTENTERTLAAVRAKGLHVHFATGRMLPCTLLYARRAGLPGPAVALNGALIQNHNGEQLEAHALTETELRQCLSFERESCRSFWMRALDIVSAESLLPYFRYMTTWNNGENHITVPKSQWPRFDGGVFQIQWVGPRSELELIEAQVKPMADLQTAIYPSIRGVHSHLEIRRKGVSKWTGIQALQRSLGVTNEQTLAIGDWINDTEMLQRVGTGVAMGNAYEPVKDFADWVMPWTNEQDGVAEFLKTHFLEEA